MAFRVTSRLADEASTPEYQAPTTVRRSPNASIDMAMPSIVSEVLSLCRNALRTRSLTKFIRQHPLVELEQRPSALCGPGVVRHHYHRLLRLQVKPLHQGQHLRRGDAVEVA